MIDVYDIAFQETNGLTTNTEGIQNMIIQNYREARAWSHYKRINHTQQFFFVYYTFLEKVKQKHPPLP